MVSKLTSKGQLTIPKSIRKKFKLHKGDKIEFFIDKEGAIRLIPVKSSVKELKGMVPPPNKKVSLEDMQIFLNILLPVTIGILIVLIQ